MQTIAELLALTPADRLDVAKRHSRTAMRLDDSGRKETAKVLSAMESQGDLGDAKDVKEYCRKNGVDLKLLKGVYEIKRVAAAVAAEEIEMDEKQFEKAASSKLQILSRFFQDKHKEKLPEGVALVIKDASAKEIRALIAEDKAKPALVVDDIPEDGAILTSDKVRKRLKADANAALDGDPEVLDEMIDRTSRLFVALAESAGQSSHEIVAKLLEELTAAQSAESEEKAAA